MPRMVDMIRSSSVPASLMQAAARGALSVPPAEMIEILVHLAVHNKVFGQQARMTLAGWEEKSSLEAAADPQTPREVLDYLIAHENLRPRLLPALLENASIPEDALAQLAASGSREIVEAMQASARAQVSSAILRALANNPNSTPREVAQLQESAHSAGSSPAELDSAGATSTGEAPTEDDAAVDAFLTEHAKELALEGDKPFQPLGGIHEFEVAAQEAAAAGTESSPEQVTPVQEAEPEQVQAVAQSPAHSAAATAPAARKSLAAKKASSSQETERGSALQKISKLDIKGRIQLAMKGTKEDRSILIRDSTKLVALAVLESPKVTDGEVEKFANQKNVLEAVLRQIPMKRRFIKNYGIVRNLVANPRTPLDVSLGLMKNLLTADLRNLSGNKEVPDTIRKLATKMFKQKTDTAKK